MSNATTKGANMATMNNVKCGKCNGAGHLTGLSHRDNGKCYACYGAGVVKCQPVTEAARIMFLTDALLTAILAGRETETRATRIANELFAAGTETARVVLAQIALGRFDDGERFHNRPDIGRKAAALIIAKGREIKAAG